MVNIACFKYGDKYDYRHVNLLYNSIKKHYKNKFSFFCIGDNGENISPEVTFIELKEEFKYAFNKVKAFSNNFLNLKRWKDGTADFLFLMGYNDISKLFFFSQQNHKHPLFKAEF